jgi:hypothetical protein
MTGLALFSSFLICGCIYVVWRTCEVYFSRWIKRPRNGFEIGENDKKGFLDLAKDFMLKKREKENEV